MIRLRLVWISVLLSLAPALLTFGGGAPVAESREVSAPAAFPHSKHVHYAWLDKNENEVARDCRGCHDFDPSDGVTSMMAGCQACHFEFPDGPALVVEGSYETEDESGETFQHVDHLDLECRKCHEPKSDLPNQVSDEMYIPTGLGWCTDCHDPKSRNADRDAVKQTAQIDFQKKINASPKMRGNPDAVFRHSEHMTPAKQNDPQQCARCHATMAGSKPDIGAELYDPSSCGACHQGEDKAALAFTTSERSFKSGADRSFYHSDHVDKDALQKSPEIRKESCFACHEERGTEGRGVSDYPLKKGFDLYQACADCHDRNGLTWKEREVAWKIDDHGDIDQKNDCAGCHVVGEAVPMKTARPTRESVRAMPTVFDFGSQKHPHIVGATDKKPKDCAKCHISVMDVAPSQIRGRAFDHEPHLPKKADRKVSDCLACHPIAKGAEKAFMEIPSSGDRHLSYLEGSCKDCHLGVDSSDPVGFESKREGVLVFDHADHVKPGDPKSLDCSKCHAEAEGGDDDYAFLDGVRDCSACHDHGEHFEATGGKKQPYVDGCSACHEAHEPGLPLPKVEYSCKRLDITAVEGAQFHPLARDRACAECHIPELTPTGMKFIREKVFVKAEKTKYEDFHGRSRRPEPPPTTCYSCHWNSFRAINQSKVSEAVVGGQIVNIEGKGHASTRDYSVVRKALGNELKGYPGLQK